MRAVFIFVVVVNVCALSWYVWRWADSANEIQVVQPGAGALAQASRIHLIVETGGGARESGERAVPSQSAAGVVVEDGSCQFVGPFKQLLKAEYFVEHLAGVNVSAQVKKLQVPGDISYWVYLEPEMSRKAALRRLHELQADGVDSFVIPKGELENGISFGLYSSEVQAQERIEALKGKGYKAQLQKIDRNVEEIWVVIGAINAAKITNELWLDLLNREEGLERRQNLCSGVAS